MISVGCIVCVWLVYVIYWMFCCLNGSLCLVVVSSIYFTFVRTPVYSSYTDIWSFLSSLRGLSLLPLLPCICVYVRVIISHHYRILNFVCSCAMFLVPLCCVYILFTTLARSTHSFYVFIPPHLDLTVLPLLCTSPLITLILPSSPPHPPLRPGIPFSACSLPLSSSSSIYFHLFYSFEIVPPLSF